MNGNRVESGLWAVAAALDGEQQSRVAEALELPGQANLLASVGGAADRRHYWTAHQEVRQDALRASDIAYAHMPLATAGPAAG